MEQGHWIRKRRGTWIIAVPPEVRDFLGVTHRMRLYWQVRRHGEAVLSDTLKAKEGQPPIRQLARELAAVRAELEGARTRDARRDRGMYAEGYAHGYLKGYEALLHPHGASAEDGRRRELWARAFPEAYAAQYPKQIGPRPAPSKPRQNAGRRRSQRVETLPAPVLEAGGVPKEEKEAADVLVPSAEAARAGREFSDSPPSAEE